LHLRTPLLALGVQQPAISPEFFTRQGRQDRKEKTESFLYSFATFAVNCLGWLLSADC
jgi:hypothetical protein